MDGQETAIPTIPGELMLETSQRASEVDTPFPPERSQAAGWPASYELAEGMEFFELDHAGGSEVPVVRPEPETRNSAGPPPEMPSSMNAAHAGTYYYRS